MNLAWGKHILGCRLFHFFRNLNAGFCNDLVFDWKERFHAEMKVWQCCIRVSNAAFSLGERQFLLCEHVWAIDIQANSCAGPCFSWRCPSRLWWRQWRQWRPRRRRPSKLFVLRSVVRCEWNQIMRRSIVHSQTNLSSSSPLLLSWSWQMHAWNGALNGLTVKTIWSSGRWREDQQNKFCWLFWKQGFVCCSSFFHALCSLWKRRLGPGFGQCLDFGVFWSRPDLVQISSNPNFVFHGQVLLHLQILYQQRVNHLQTKPAAALTVAKSCVVLTQLPFPSTAPSAFFSTSLWTRDAWRNQRQKLLTAFFALKKSLKTTKVLW